MNAARRREHIAEITSGQWGMVTAAQAARFDVSRLHLSRMAESGELERLTHGVYKDVAVPFDEYENLRAAWLSTVPSLLAEERIAADLNDVVVAGQSATWLHRVGDLRAQLYEFTTKSRRQTQRHEIQYRMRQLERTDVTIVAGLPITTVERTIADLIEARTDKSLVADVIRDSVKGSTLDHDRLVELLAPLATRNGFVKNAGQQFLDQLLVNAGVDLDSLVERVLQSSGVSEALSKAVEQSIPKLELPQVAKIMEHVAKLQTPQIKSSSISHHQGFQPPKPMADD